MYYHKAILMGLLCQISRTVRTEEPTTIEPEPNAIQLLEPVETGTVCFFKLRIGTGKFWNRPSTNKKIHLTFYQVIENI